MPVTRMKMRPWLEKMINSNTIPGLAWIDKEKTMFSIPWKHAARHGWDMDKDACLFKQWAIHTGKYGESGSRDAKTWKANFRCAMNSLPDIEEVKDKSVNKGQSAMRVFRMLPVVQKSREKRSRVKSRKQVKMAEEDTDYSDTQSPPAVSQLRVDAASAQENVVDSTVDVGLRDYATSPFDFPDLFPAETAAGRPQDNFLDHFQISPDQSPEYDPDIVEICKQLERDAQSLGRNCLDIKGLLSNDASTSPGSHWSDTSSDCAHSVRTVDEVDDLQYTTLGPDFTNVGDSLLGEFCPTYYLDTRLSM
uniref:interferon regulatory factor 1b isoform X2 n=1 Tax=Doryrhamphus excisus TaxID=161450 RepID=UPI0025AEB7CC|nr:interferon regulatory factor 1b isoform X2 [Doryrhamphus excisus]